MLISSFKFYIVSIADLQSVPVLIVKNKVTIGYIDNMWSIIVIIEKTPYNSATNGLLYFGTTVDI